MKVYKSKVAVLPGSSYEEVYRHAWREHKIIEKLTKRNPYVRSKYFSNQKIFVSPIFWAHLKQERLRSRTKRLKLYKAAIDLMRNSRCEPETIFDNGNLSILLHRFYGVSKDGTPFCVQVKENKRTGRKDFISVFWRKAP